MKNIHIGKVELPLKEFVVSRNAGLGITRSGKTYLFKGIAEQLIDAGVPILVFDAIGVWRYLKVPSGLPGGKGFPIVVAGGAQPDLQLNYPNAVEREELGRLAEMSASSGSFGTYLAKLRTLELVEGKSELRASSEFFE